MADALALGASGETLEGSTPSSRTKFAKGGFDLEIVAEPYFTKFRGSSSVVELLVANEKVAGSNPVSRSII